MSAVSVGDNVLRRRFPAVTALLIGANVLVFGAAVLFPWYPEPSAVLGFIPRQAALYTLFTSAFLHAGFLHLLFNMWFLFLFGDHVEDALGRAFFAGFYVCGAVFAALVHMLIVAEAARDIPFIGAGGAIGAVMGGYAVLFPRARINCLWRFGVQNVGAPILFALWFVVQLAYGEHIGGFLFGAVFIWMMKRSGFIVVSEPPALKAPQDAGSGEQQPGQSEFYERKLRIERLWREGSSEEALEAYAQFEAAGLPRACEAQVQKEIGDALAARGNTPLALQAYTRFLAEYPRDLLVPEVKCRMGLLLYPLPHALWRAVGFLCEGMRSCRNIPPEICQKASVSLDALQAVVRSSNQRVQEEVTDKAKYALYALDPDDPLVDEARLFDAFLLLDRFRVGANFAVSGSLGTRLAYKLKYSMSRNKGLILRGLSGEEAAVALKRLESFGILTALVPEHLLHGYLPVRYVRQAVLLPAGVAFDKEEGGERISVHISAIRLVCAGEVLDGALLARSPAAGVSVLIDVFTDAGERLRMAGSSCVFVREGAGFAGAQTIPVEVFIEEFAARLGPGVREALACHRSLAEYERAVQASLNRLSVFSLFDEMAISGGAG